MCASVGDNRTLGLKIILSTPQTPFLAEGFDYPHGILYNNKKNNIYYAENNTCISRHNSEKKQKYMNGQCLLGKSQELAKQTNDNERTRIM